MIRYKRSLKVFWAPKKQSRANLDAESAEPLEPSLVSNYEFESRW